MDFEAELAALRSEIDAARRKRPDAGVGVQFDCLLAGRLQREFPSLGVHALDRDGVDRQVEIGGKRVSPDIVITGSPSDDPHDPNTWKMLIEASTAGPDSLSKPWKDGAKYAAGRAILKEKGVPVVFVSLYAIPMTEVHDQGQGIYDTSKDKVIMAGTGTPLGPKEIRWSVGAFLGAAGDKNAWFWIEREPGVTDALFGSGRLPEGASGGLKVPSGPYRSSLTLLFLLSKLLASACACTDVSCLGLDFAPATEQAINRSRLAWEFKAAFEILQRLSGRRLGDSRVARLDQIYGANEAAWTENLVALGSTPVRYLMLAEAAPWSDSGRSPYFYTTGGNGLPANVAKAFRVEGQHWSRVLDRLAQRGFLLIDSVPFAIDYSRLRRSPSYTELVAACWPSYVLPQLARVSRWADHVLVGLAFQVNGEEIITASGGSLRLPHGDEVLLQPHQIAANAAGYPDVAGIRRVFGLP